MLAVQKQKKIRLPSLTNAETKALRERQISATPVMRGIGSMDPVYILSQSFSKQFDAVGQSRAKQMSGREDTPEQSAEMPEQSPESGEDSPDKKLEGLRAKHDAAEYSHNRQDLVNGDFADRFASYAFRGGRLAGAVLDGGAKNMFVTCARRAVGLPNPDIDRERKLVPHNTVKYRPQNLLASVTANRNIRGALGITVDAIKGATTVLDIFRQIANGADTRYDLSIMTTSYPFLVIRGDEMLIEKYKADLKALEGDFTAEGLQKKRAAEFRLKKQEAVLYGKKQQQRNFLTQITQMLTNAKEAAKQFSSDDFADSVIKEIFDGIAEDAAGDDDPNGRKGGREEQGEAEAPQSGERSEEA